ncbi:MAG TPA: lactate dehydrogenase [Anaerolineaceae bacterium]|uniref:Malate dehydrogenase n=1 Tax=Anaerolinea thermophila TaxID=167964 RepID=A0A101FXQ7_9CHLR|nr:MAG: Malate dehydrogenase [Anaerolinea thermophila]HAF61920.1 lactate dehydrogenase [Anaerolineaceae bacterium]
MSQGIVKISVDVLYEFMIAVFTRTGLSKPDAKACADVLIKSDLRGIESHGVGRLRMYYERLNAGLIEPHSSLTIVRESPTTAVIDGNHSMGMVVATQSMQMAIDKAKQFGMGAVAVRNSTHFGIDGYYPLMAVEQNMIGMSFTNARPCVSPTHGTLPTLGTNPISFGAPTDEECPFLYDGATSITQRGKIEVLARAEKPVPVGWVVDSQNEPMIDADDILQEILQDQAALLPLGGSSELLGGHKGYCLSTIVEILSSALQSGAFLFQLSGFDPEGNPSRFRVGHFFMAMNIENFLSVDEFKKNIGDLLRTLRATRNAPGQTRIYTAGEKEFEMEKIVKQEGVPVNKNLRKDILFLQHELGLDEFIFHD